MPEQKTRTAYRTVAGDSEIEIVEKRSRFIGRCFSVSDENEALTILERIRKENWDATHNCYAYRLQNGAARYSDDGEPSGTAGMPMMEALKNMQVSDLLVIVTRYFGGILLGTGGLVRAYSKATCEAVHKSGIIRMLPCTAFFVQMNYSHWNTVQKLCERYGRIEKTEFTDTVQCTVWIEYTRADAFLKALTDRTEGRVTASPIREDCFPFPASEDIL